MDNSLVDDLRLVKVVLTSVPDRILSRNPSEEQVETLIEAATAASSSILKITELISAESLKEKAGSFGRTEPANCSNHFRESTNEIKKFRQEAARGDLAGALTYEELSKAIQKNESYSVCVERLRTRGNELFAEESKAHELNVVESEDYQRIWIECCEMICEETFHKKKGARLAAHLSRTTPGQCASWLECLKQVAEAIHLSRDCNARAGISKNSGLMKETGVFVEEITCNKAPLVKEISKTLAVSMSFLWPELKETGLLSNRWRARLAAIELAAVLYDADSSDLTVNSNKWLLQIYKELLDLLVSPLALTDSHWQVRRGAVQCASQILRSFRSSLPVAESDFYVWGFLAASLDNHSEVQKAVAETLLSDNLVPGSHYCEETIFHLIEKFVTTACLSVRHLQKKSKNMQHAEVEGFKDSSDISLLLASIDGAIHLRLLGESASTQADLECRCFKSSVPLLVASAAALLEESEISKTRVRIMEVSKMLRSLVGFHYAGHVIAMISSRGQSYTGPSIAKFYKAASVIDGETADVLNNVEVGTILKGVAVALEGLECVNDMQAFQQGDAFLGSPEFAKLEVKALEHIVEMVEIPSSFVQTTKDTQDNDKAAKFLYSCYYFLRIASAILKHYSWKCNSNEFGNELVQRLLLSCAALASADGDTGASLSWITEDIQVLAVEIVQLMSNASFEKCWDASATTEAPEVPKLDMKGCNGIERLVMLMLPSLLLKFKSQLKDDLSTDSEGNFTATSRGASLTSAIIAAYQMYWCLKQVKHPRVGPFCTMLMPCALMALDHYSSHVKRQAIKVFIHLVDNLNPSELRWYKDATLDCVTRNIIGCGELWPLVVKMSVQLVTCIEGKNPRGRWFGRILDEMLGELERHQNDADRCTVWLQNVVKLFEAMGLVLVAHFNRLLPILFSWLHTLDDSIRILVLQALQTIIRHTWPRMPFHAERFWRELAATYKESRDQRSGADIRAAVIEVCLLLKMCAGSAFEAARQNSGGNSMEDSLNYALDHMPELQGA